MARSSYIYTVIPFAGHAPAAAFTVKHELVTWIKRYFPAKPGKFERPIRVYRLPDGGLMLGDKRPVFVKMDLKELLGEE